MNITKVEQLEETESFQMDWKGHKVNFEAYKNSLTPQVLKDVGEVVSYPKAVATIIADWDVTKNEDDKWPLTEEELARLPIPFLDAILNKVSESWAGDKKKQSASANG